MPVRLEDVLPPAVSVVPDCVLIIGRRNSANKYADDHDDIQDDANNDETDDDVVPLLKPRGNRGSKKGSSKGGNRGSNLVLADEDRIRGHVIEESLPDVSSELTRFPEARAVRMMKVARAA